VTREAELRDTGAGLVPASEGWFVLNARDARWFRRPGRGHSLPLTGVDEYEAETFFPLLGMGLYVLGPGEPNSVYHWEADAEAFLLLAGEAILLVEGEERPLKQWDFVHCPPETNHAFVGAGDGPCVFLAVSSRQFQASGNWGAYTVDEAARRHGASPDEETDDSEAAYARFPVQEPMRYREGLLPE
jgi:uncharacterized cupin superfamily protein